MRYMLDESKQVGVLYHFTDARGALYILKDKIIKSGKKDFISFTRYFNLNNIWKDFMDKRAKSLIRFSIDGDILSNKYSIKSYSHGVTQKYSYKLEGEEVINQSKVFLNNSILRLDIDKQVWHLKTNLGGEAMVNSYIFGEFKDQVLESDIPCYLVDKFEPFKSQKGERLN